MGEVECHAHARVIGPLLALFFGCEKPCAAPLYRLDFERHLRSLLLVMSTQAESAAIVSSLPAGLIGGNRSVLRKRRHR
jgi:hypothetical protein